MSRITELKPRKKPRQLRAESTVDAILEATARVLMEDGYDRASTNRIAKRAGVSVGSLYQYFPSKESLVLEVARRHSNEMIGVLATAAVELANEPIDVAIGTYVRAMLAAHAVNPELHKVMVEQVMHLGIENVDDLQEQARQLVKAYLTLHANEILPKNIEMAAFVLVSAVGRVTHGAVLYAPEHLEDRAFEDELCALIRRYLLGSPAA